MQSVILSFVQFIGYWFHRSSINLCPNYSKKRSINFKSMKKSFTILSFFIGMVLTFSVSAQEANSSDQKAGSKMYELAKRNTTSLPSLFFSKTVLLANGYTEEQLKTDFKMTSDGLYQPFDKSEKLDELYKANKPAMGHPADVAMQMLPKVNKQASFEQTVSEYHNVLEEMFAKNPSLLSSLGAEFEKAYNSPELFREVVKTALDKGHSAN